jgi:hypothetical protein
MINKKYRKKPVVIEAVEYERDKNISSCMDFCPDMIYNQEDNEYDIVTLEGRMRISKGDYIIKGVNGEFYPCKPDIFRKTYEEVAISKTETTSEPCDYCKNTDYLKRNLTFVDRYYEQNIEPKFCPNCGRQL